MEPFILSSLLLENNQRFFNYPGLYVRSTAPVFYDTHREAWRYIGPGTYDFTTYFNGLSTIKWKRYTQAKEFYLHLELRGEPCKVYFSHADAMTKECEPVLDDEPFLVTESDDAQNWQMIDVLIPVRDEDVINGFFIEASGEFILRNTYYYTLVETESLRPVDISLVTTTYKKEAFVLKNLNLIEREIFKTDNPLKDHLYVHVIDNGRTLDAEALTRDRITIHPNNNAGGAGGFARGMIESLEQTPPATHVLLMDDDVAISPESLIRTYRLLRIVNDEFSRAFVSGAMIDYMVCDSQWEDIGYMTPEGRFSPLKERLRLSLLCDMVANESYVVPEAFKDCSYAAWWYCCIPLDVIREFGLPLPVFVRCDDAEYSIRCQPKIMSMNGICIWHLSFHARYSAAVERYQTTRNTLIGQFATNMAPNSDFLGELNGNIQIELKKFNYTNAELLLDGFEDFMRGPDFIGQPVAEECFMRANRRSEKLIPFDELQRQIDASDDIDIDLGNVTAIELEEEGDRSLKEAALDFITYNGQRIPFMEPVDGVSVIPAAGWMYPAGKLHGRSAFVAVDPYTRRGVIRRLDRKRFNEIMRRYRRDLRQYKKTEKDLRFLYAAAAPWLTSVEFWRSYLDI